MPTLELGPDRLALVTGAGSGIGRATAAALVARGVDVVAVDRDGDRLASLAAELGSRVVAAEVLDVADRRAFLALADRIERTHGVPDLVVNNAGVAVEGGLLDTSLDDWDWLLGINLGGVIHGCHAFAPKLAARGRGQIVNVSSILGIVPLPKTVAYCTSKFAVYGLSLSLRGELAPRGVGVSVVCPGVVATDIIRAARFAGGGEAARQRTLRLYERRRFGPERVAKALIEGALRDRAVILVTPEAHVLRALEGVRFGLASSVAAALGRL